MTERIIYIIPFDIGCSFLEYEYNKKQKESDFLTTLREKTKGKNIDIDIKCCKKYMCIVTIDEYTQCILLKSGIGVFIIKYLPISDKTGFQIEFKDFPVCMLYYNKKSTQKNILDHNGDFKKLRDFMQIVWNSTAKNTRALSANISYKHSGLSYSMAIYHLIESNYPEKLNVSLLMNPDILSGILSKDKWASIKDKIPLCDKKEFNSIDFTSTSKVLSSWSAVAVLEKEETDTIMKIIAYETELQASWFLFDCMIDNINGTNMSLVNLQKAKNLITNVSLDINTILSANIGTNEKNIMNDIYTTSGIQMLEKKLDLLLENRIALAEAKLYEKQGIYSTITEILLILFTLVSIYEPVKSMLTGSLSKSDIIVGAIMLLLFLISTIFIIKKEK